MMKWILLGAAILSEVVATTSLKYSEGFTRWLPSTVVVVGYLVSFVLLAKVLTTGLPIGLVYALWAAAGVFLVALLGVLLFHERLSALQVAGLVLIVAGVAALQSGPGATHS